MVYSDLKEFFLRWRMYLLAVLVAVALLWCVPPWQVEQVRLHLDKPADEYRLAKLKDEYRRTLAQIFGGLALLYGLYLTQRRIVATEDNVRVAQEGQITERFTRAIEQLGNGNLAIRLGGIYALERLARDSEKDHGPIMEVLTAYVREQEAAGILANDIQAILTVIGRRETTGNNRGNDPLDLTHAELVRADLRGADLVEASLVEANLFRANLHEAALVEANLSGADLHEAALGGAVLIGATLSGANLSGAILSRADLSDAILIGTDLVAAILVAAILVAANLSEATLSGANLGGAILREADLRGTVLSDAILIGADLSGADLSGADLSGADLRRADLRRADLRGTDLSRAENLTAEQVQTAENWRDALLPASLQYLLTE